MTADSAPNLMLMNREWLPQTIRSIRQRITDMEAEVAKARAELEEHLGVAHVLKLQLEPGSEPPVVVDAQS